MGALVVRLAGPLQSWGAEPRLRTVTTHSTPTWSALLGLSRAALGHGHADPLDRIAWLRKLTMAVRVDQPGTARSDFQTINPLPKAYGRYGIDETARGLVPVGTTLQARTGQAPRWLSGSAPMVTRRVYLHDAAFTWLIEGPDVQLLRLASALEAPRWALALGRKGCTPATPLLLGQHDGDLTTAAHTVPVLARHGDGDHGRLTDLVWIAGTPNPELPRVGLTRVVVDDPLGAEPQDGHAPNNHTVTRVVAPVLPPSQDGTFQQRLLTWADTHLTRPRLSQEPQP